MTASQRDAALAQEPPELPAGIVRIELVPASLPWRGSMEEAVLRRRGQYIAGVEYLARALDAQEPLVWEEDATLLVLTGTPAAKLPARVLEAARELWARIRVELGLSARIAAHVGKARVGTEAGAFGGADVARCRQLAAQAPADRVVLTEDLALALPEQTQRELAMLGRLEGEEGLVYAFAADRALAGTAPFVFGEAEIRRDKLRAYAGGPDVRLIRYVGFRLHRKEPPRLDVRDVFVPSQVELRRHAEIARPAALPRQALETALSPWEPRASADPGGPPLPFRDVFARHHSLVVLGDPGSGKTTLLRWLAVIAASGRFELDAELGVPERLLPIPVSVGRLAEIRRTLGDGGASVPEALARYLHDRSLGEVAEIRTVLERDLDAGSCLVLLDGLDEVKTEERDAVRDWLQAFAAAHPRNRFVVSSRRYGYTGIELPGGPVEVVLHPFNDEQVERYVRAFHQAYVRWESGADPASVEDADELLRALHASPRLSALARNPFMLSALALTHRAEGRLPRHRVQAYELFARALCETWAEARRLVAGAVGGPVIEYEEEALPILGELALAMHEQHPTGVAPEEFVVDQIAGALERQRGLPRQPARRAAEGFLRRAAEEVQILLERGAGEWGFLHLTFQEFFVAAGLHAIDRFEEEAMQHVFDPRWEEVVRLGVGYMALVQKRPKPAQRFVERVLGYEAPEPRSWVTSVLRAQIPLAALLAAEAGGALPASLQERVAEALAKWVETAPDEIAQRYLDELSLTDFAARVGATVQRLLTDDRREVRARAAWALGRLRFARAADDLIAQLSDGNLAAREAAAQALGWIAVDDAAQRLTGRFEKGGPEVRAAVMTALEVMGENAPFELVRLGLKDAEEQVRVAATKALRSQPPAEAVVALREMTEDPSSRVRIEAARICACIGQVDLLLKLLQDESVRLAAASLIVYEDDGASLRIPAVAELLLASNHTYVLDRAERIRAMDLLHVPLEKRIDALRGPSENVRAAAARSLARVGDALQPLLMAAADEAPRVRVAALYALSTLEEPRTLEALRLALKDPEHRVRLHAACRLGILRDPASLPLLANALESQYSEDERLAARGLAWLGTEEAKKLLMDSIKKDHSYFLVNVDALVSRWPSESVSLLLERLRQEQDPFQARDLRGYLWAIFADEQRRAQSPT